MFTTASQKLDEGSIASSSAKGSPVHENHNEDNGNEHAAAPGNASLVMRDSVWIENYL